MFLPLLLLSSIIVVSILKPADRLVLGTVSKVHRLHESGILYSA